MANCILNIVAIEEALCDHKDAIWQRYGMGRSVPQDDVFADVLVDSLNQPVQPTDGAAATVFRAAALSIASNMRNWGDVQLAVTDVLDGFGTEVPSAVDTARLASILPGQTGRKDAEGIADWAGLLQRESSYYSDTIEPVRDSFRTADPALPDEHAFLCVAAYFSAEKGWKATRSRVRPPQQGTRKWPQMGMPLACEFLRNLGWNGFKPDTHVIRLLGKWWQECAPESDGTMKHLERLIGRTGRNQPPYLPRHNNVDPNLRCQLVVALAGIAMTPDGNYSRADNLLWLLGSEVEKRCDRLPEKYLRRRC